MRKNKYLSYEQFIEVSDSIRNNTGYITEYANGRILYFRPNISAKHNKIMHNIVNISDDKLPSGCIAINNLHIKFNAKEYRAPDVSVICDKEIEMKYENDLLHLEIPKLIFEVIDDFTEKNDRENKMKCKYRGRRVFNSGL